MMSVVSALQREVGGEEGQSEVEVDEDDAEDENDEGERCCDAGEYGERHGEQEEEGNDECVDRIEEGHSGEPWLCGCYFSGR